MKKIITVLATAVLLFASCGDKAQKGKSVKIGIAKIVQHPALDDIEKGVIDVLGENNIKAEYDLQNANGDVNNAMQIANQYKVKKVDVAVGIATPVAVALATTLKDIPVVFGTVTDPLGAGRGDRPVSRQRPFPGPGGELCRRVRADRPGICPRHPRHRRRRRVYERRSL